MGGTNPREKMYSDEEILSALYETLGITQDNLNTLLTMDHPPHDYLDKIYEENKIVSDLKSLIRDHEARVAAHNLISLF